MAWGITFPSINVFPFVIFYRDLGNAITLPADHRLECLWSAGFIANRSELAGSNNLSGSVSDQQLLLHLYQEYGIDTVQRIVGPFTWVLWDGDQQTLVAARDRIGIHEIYFATHKGIVLVAGRVEALLDSISVLHKPNPNSIVAQINAEVPFVGETFYADIQSVEPGGLLIVTRGHVEVKRYWSLKPQPNLKLASDREYADALRALLFQVVAEYLPASSYAITLSGGLDSTTVAAAIKSVAPDLRHTAISWDSPELPSADESMYSLAVARQLDFSCVKVRADLHYPLSAPNGIKTWPSTPFYGFYTELWDAAYKTIKQLGINILFTGSSGDHLFGGNVFAYPDLLLTGQWLELAHQIRNHLPYSGVSLKQLIRTTVLSPILRTWIPRWRSNIRLPVPWLNEKYHSLFAEHWGRPMTSYRMLPGKLLRFRVLSDRTLPRNFLQMKMQGAEYNIEIRHPLLDHRLFEFALSLPTTQTFRAGARKTIIRNAMRGYLPDDLLDRKYKIYPDAIAERGLKERETAKVWNLMTNMRAAEMGFVDEKKLQENYRDYLAGKHNSALFWHTITLEDWLRRYF